MLQRLGDIVEALGGTLVGSPDLQVSRLAALDRAQSGSLSFLSHPKYSAQLKFTQASVVIVSEAGRLHARPDQALIVTPQPYLYFAQLTQWWKKAQAQSAINASAYSVTEPLIHSSAVVHPDARLHPSVRVGAFCLIERGVTVEEGTWLKSRVTLSEGSHLGRGCLVHPGVVIGADGFGFAKDEAFEDAQPDNSETSEGYEGSEGSSLCPSAHPSSLWVKIEQLGGVQIGDEVEIGANTCIDRGALEDTVLGHGVKLDNLIQIAHNVHIGDHTAMAACVGVAGSAKIGRFCTIGGGAIVLGHLELADHVHISAATVVTRSISKAGHYSGIYPLQDNALWEKNAVTLKQAYKLRERILALEKTRS